MKSLDHGIRFLITGYKHFRLQEQNIYQSQEAYAGK